MALRLNVVDGGDRGQKFALPPAGKVRIGNYGGHTDICLHDLYVAKDHCHVDVAADGTVMVTAQPSAAGTLVNGAKVAQHELKPGDVLRVGNSYLKLEEATDDTLPHTNGLAPSQTEAPTDPQIPTATGPLPHLPPERLRELTYHTLGHYVIGPALAPGPVGTVFRAKDTKTGQDVALKVLPADFPAADAEVQRLVRVMKQFLPLHHTGLAQLRGVGKTGPYVWVASELVPGDSVTVAIRTPGGQKKGKWRLALRVARHMARTLDFLHRRRLVHGSVSPANVLLAAGDGPPVLKDAGLWDALAGRLVAPPRGREAGSGRTPVLVARARGARIAGGRPVGSILLGCGGLRLVDGPAAVRGWVARGNRQQGANRPADATSRGMSRVARRIPGGRFADVGKAAGRPLSQPRAPDRRPGRGGGGMSRGMTGRHQ